MIRPLRQLHRAVWTPLGLLLPLLLLAALGSRPPVPPPTELPALARFVVPTTHAASGPWQGGAAARARRLRDASGDELRQWVELEMLEEAPGPDLLVYWIDGAIGPDSEARWTDGWLLGEAPSTAGRFYALPGPARDGTLLVYSLAHREAREAIFLAAESD